SSTCRSSRGRLRSSGGCSLGGSLLGPSGCFGTCRRGRSCLRRLAWLGGLGGVSRFLGLYCLLGSALGRRLGDLSHFRLSLIFSCCCPNQFRTKKIMCKFSEFVDRQNDLS